MTRLPYFVTAVGNFRPLDLTRDDRIALRDALQREPSDFMCLGIAFAINTYVETCIQQREQSPEKVENRVRRVLDASRELVAAISDLRGGDRIFLDRYWTAKESDDPLDEKQVAAIAWAFANDVEQAAGALSLVERRGAMPAYPAKGLAKDIAHLLYLERGERPACTTGGEFDRLLRAALAIGNARLNGVTKYRRDTKDLMRFALEKFDPGQAEIFRAELSRWKKPLD